MKQQVTACGCGASSTHAHGLCSTCYRRHRAKEQAYGRWDARPTARVAPDRAMAHRDRLRAAGMQDRHIELVAGIHGTGDLSRLPHQVTVTREIEAAILAVPIPERAADVVPPTSRVPIHGARRRIQALIADGHSRKDLAQRLGIGHPNGLATLVGRSAHSARVTGESVTAARDQQVRTLFDELQLTPGSSERARALGKRQGWPRPLEWDEDQLDRPDGRPTPCERTPEAASRGAREEREEKVLALTESGRSIVEIAEEVGTTTRTVERIRLRRDKILARMAAQEQGEEVAESEDMQVMEMTEDE
ncbi:hypothetical protein ACWCPQ_33580 [Nocardia sp. NPDC001965]